MDTIKCYVDGSYSPKSVDSNLSGWGVVFEDGETLSGTIPHEGMRQVAGEVIATIKALRAAIRKEVRLVRVFYDYEGLPKWASKEWKAKNPMTKTYQDLFKQINGKLFFGHENDDHLVEVKFIKIDPAINRADALATKAIGIESVH